MVNPQMVMYEEEFNQIQVVVDRLVRDANAKVVFIVDKNGQLIAASRRHRQRRHDEPGLPDRRQHRRDRRHGQAPEGEGVRHPVPRGREGQHPHPARRQPGHPGRHLRLQVVASGLVRLRVKKASEELNHIFESLLKKVQEPGGRLAVRRDHGRRHRQPLQRLRGRTAADELHQLHGPRRSTASSSITGPVSAGRRRTSSTSTSARTPSTKGR